jgi:hypothetical protein
VDEEGARGVGAGVLRRMALNLIGILRQRASEGGWKGVKPPWRAVIEAVKAVMIYGVRSREVAFG